VHVDSVRQVLSLFSEAGNTERVVALVQVRRRNIKELRQWVSSILT
jgi:hypothetical protein